MDGPTGGPLVSIVIASYNRANLVERAVRSALNQTYPNIEVFVSDDHSPDDTLAVLDKIRDPRLRVHAQPRNVGVWENWTAAANGATGDYLVFLGDDDYLTPNFAELHVAAFNRHPEVAVVFSPMQDETLDGKSSGVMKPYIQAGQVAGPEAIIEGLLAARLFFGSAMFRRKLAIATWLTTRAEDMVADWGLLFRLSLIDRVKSTGCTGSNYHKTVHPNRLSSRWTDVTTLLSDLYLRMAPHCPDPRQRRKFRRLSSLERITLARHHAALGSLAECRRELWRALRICPWIRHAYTQLAQSYFYPGRLTRTAREQRGMNA